MKKRILLFTAIAGMGYLGFSSYITGPGTNGYDCTGAETGLGNPTGCSTGGNSCHSTTATTGITISLEVDSTGGVPVTQYVPGSTYTVKINGSNTTANNLPKFGFQVGAIKGSSAVATPVNAGTFQSTGLPTNVHYKAATGAPDFVVNVVEHTAQLSPTSGTGGTGTTYAESFTWTAPAAGTGTVSLWGALNAVNNDNTNTAADKWNTTHIVLTELSSTSVARITAKMGVKFYPNPVSANLNIQLDNAQAGTYSLLVFDIAGRIISNENIAVNNPGFTTQVNTANWAIGMYTVVLQKDGFSKIVSVVKK